MRKSAFWGSFLASALFLAANPAQARVTVVDGGVLMTVGGYCTPGQAGASDCAPQALPFHITIGGVEYDSFILNGNGTLTLGTTGIDWTTVSNSAPNLASYPMPVFSPQNDNQIIGRALSNPAGFDQDTKWAASVTTSTGNLTAYWFLCTSAIFCGKDSLPAVLYDGPLTQEQVIERQSWGMFGLSLTDIGAGSFRLDYFYDPVYALNGFSYDLVADPQGTYGFNAPGGPSLQQTGSLVNRSFIFDSEGVRAVPEPASWMTMLLGFAGLGLVMRSRRRREPSLA